MTPPTPPLVQHRAFADPHIDWKMHVDALDETTARAILLNAVFVSEYARDAVFE